MLHPNTEILIPDNDTYKINLAAFKREQKETVVSAIMDDKKEVRVQLSKQESNNRWSAWIGIYDAETNKLVDFPILTPSQFPSEEAAQKAADTVLESLTEAARIIKKFPSVRY